MPQAGAHATSGVTWSEFLELDSVFAPDAFEGLEIALARLWEVAAE